MRYRNRPRPQRSGPRPRIVKSRTKSDQGRAFPGTHQCGKCMTIAVCK
jgi:hypothetical protein